MSDQTDISTEGGAEATSGAAAPSATASPAEGAAAGLQAALLAERGRRQDLERRIAAIDAEKEAAEAAAAAERGEYRELYEKAEAARAAAAEKLDALTAREAARLERVGSDNAARLAALPEALQALVPSNLGVDTAAAQIGRLERLAAEKTYPAGTRRGSGVAPAVVIPDDCAAEAHRHGKDPEWWYKTIYQPRMARRNH